MPLNTLVYALLLFLFLPFPCPSVAQSLLWTATSLSEARAGLAATSVGSLTLFAGGFVNSTSYTPSSAVDVYNASSASWTTASLSQARYYPIGATTINGLALIAGGTYNPMMASAVVDIYNASSNGWTIATLSQARTYMAATSVGELTLFAGGVRNSSSVSVSAVVDIYNASTNGWTTASLSQARFVMAATTVGNLSLFAGGYDSSGAMTSAVDIYNYTSNSWSTTTLSQARYWLAATSVGSLAFFAGGSPTSSVVDIYNESSNSWTVASLSLPRYALVATSVGDLAFFAGGFVNLSYPVSVVDIYNCTDGSWTTTTLSQPRAVLAAASAGSQALFAGGLACCDATVLSTVDILTEPNPSPSVSPSASASASPSASAAPSLSASISPSPSASVVPRPCTGVVSNFNFSTPAIDISCQSSGGEAASTPQATLKLLSLEEFLPQDNTVLQSIDLQAARWTYEGFRSEGNITHWVFLTPLTKSTAGTNNATLQYLFNTFSADMLLTTESNYSFLVTPAFLKFSLNITSWAWKSTAGRLRLTIEINPSFLDFLQWHNTPQTGMTTFLLRTRGEEASLFVRMLNFGETRVGDVLLRVPMEPSVLVESSTLRLIFDHFNDTLFFDPDFGLLLGSDAGKGNDGAGGSNTGIVIGVAVAVPVAVVLVVVVIGVILAVLMYKRRMEREQLRRVITNNAV